MSKYVTTAAITLRMQPRGEDDRLYTLYTSALGLVDAVADGSQKILSKLAGHLEPFGEVVVTLARRGQIYKLSGAITRRRYRQIFAFGIAIDAAGTCLRLTRQLVGNHHPEAGTYALLREMLEQLDAPLPEPAMPMAPTVYALQLLTHLGFQPQLTRCGRCQIEVREGAFDVVAGSMRCPKCVKGSTGPMVRVDAATVSYLQAIVAQSLSQALRISIAPQNFAIVQELVAQFAEYHTEVSRLPSPV